MFGKRLIGGSLLGLGLLASAAFADVHGEQAGSAGVGTLPGMASPQGLTFDPPGDVSGDDVGSLPMVDDGSDGLGSQEIGGEGSAPFGKPDLEEPGPTVGRPTVALTGRPAALRAAVHSAYGSGFVVSTPLPDGTQRFTFHGDVTLELDAHLLATGAVRLGIEVSEPFAPAYGAVQWNGYRTKLFPLSAGQSLDVPAPLLLRSADPRAGALRFDAVGGVGAQGYHLSLEADGRALHAVQSGS